MTSKRLLLRGLLIMATIGATVPETSDTNVAWNCGQVAVNRGGFMTDDGQQRQDNNPFDNMYHFNELPAMPHCESPSDNARGVYNSYMAPCEFAFHKWEGSVDEKDDNSHGSPFKHLPTVCSDKNKVELPDTKTSTVTHYVWGWKDECLASFPRCYSLTKQRDILADFVCRKKWKIPFGTTHMSVNCTKDATLKKARIAEMQNASGRYTDPMQQAQEKQIHLEHKRWSELRALVTSLMTVLVMLCFGFSCCCYLFVIRPYLSLSHDAKRAEFKDLINRKEQEEEVLSHGKPLRRRNLGPSEP